MSTSPEPFTPSTENRDLAADYLGLADRLEPTSDQARAYIATAQVFATLAVADEQRLANLIAWSAASIAYPKLSHRIERDLGL